MKYVKIIEELKQNYEDKIIEKNQIKNIVNKLYNTNNEKTVRNIIGILKNNNTIKEISKGKYIVVTKAVFNYQETEAEKTINKIIKKEYPEVGAVVWNTNVLNKFTLHYAVSNYTIVETEKFAVEAVVNLLKTNYLKKCTVITQEIFNQNRNLYTNTENLVIVKPMVVKSPLSVQNGKKVVSIEKLMVDLYVDPLYLQYQGKELETIYENIFERYDIDLKRLFRYAEIRTDVQKFRQFFNDLEIPEKYKMER